MGRHSRWCTGNWFSGLRFNVFKTVTNKRADCLRVCSFFIFIEDAVDRGLLTMD
jgi:hypothetical protein